MSQTAPKFTLKNCRSFSDELLEVLKPFAEKHGLQITTGPLTVGDSRLKIPLELLVANADPTKVVGTPEYYFAKNAFMVGLTAADLGREFTSNGKTFKLSGWLVKARTQPVLAVCVKSQKVYKFTLDAIRRLVLPKAPA